MKDALKKQLARCRKGLCLLLVLAWSAAPVRSGRGDGGRGRDPGGGQRPEKEVSGPEPAEEGPANQLKTIQANKSDALDKKDNLEQQVAVIQDEISNLQQQISAYEGLIGQKANELAETRGQGEGAV